MPAHTISGGPTPD